MGEMDEDDDASASRIADLIMAAAEALQGRIVNVTESRAKSRGDGLHDTMSDACEQHANGRRTGHITAAIEKGGMFFAIDSDGRLLALPARRGIKPDEIGTILQWAARAYGPIAGAGCVLRLAEVGFEKPAGLRCGCGEDHPATYVVATIVATGDVMLSRTTYFDASGTHAMPTPLTEQPFGGQPYLAEALGHVFCRSEEGSNEG